MQFANTSKQADLIGNLKILKALLMDAKFEKNEFSNDVKGLIEHLEKQKEKALSPKDVAIETEDFMDLLLCGTEVAGSCQRIDGNSSLNKGLLGYLVDGKNRLLAIKTEAGPKGRIEARCLLRLLWDGDRPVLLRENFYPSPINPLYKKALNSLAEKKAKAMGLSLVSLDGEGEMCKTLYALGGPAPFEYVDAASGGIQKNGKCVINHAKFFKKS